MEPLTLGPTLRSSTRRRHVRVPSIEEEPYRPGINPVLTIY